MNRTGRTVVPFPRIAAEPEHPITPGLLRDVAAAVRAGDAARAAALCAQVPPEYDDPEFGTHVPLSVHAVKWPTYEGPAVTASILGDAHAAVARLARVLGLHREEVWTHWTMPVVVTRYAATLGGIRIQLLHTHAIEN